MPESQYAGRLADQKDRKPVEQKVGWLKSLKVRRPESQ